LTVRGLDRQHAGHPRCRRGSRVPLVRGWWSHQRTVVTVRHLQRQRQARAGAVASSSSSCICGNVREDPQPDVPLRQDSPSKQLPGRIPSVVVHRERWNAPAGTSGRRRYGRRRAGRVTQHSRANTEYELLLVGPKPRRGVLVKTVVPANAAGLKHAREVVKRRPETCVRQARRVDVDQQGPRP